MKTLANIGIAISMLFFVSSCHHLEDIISPKKPEKKGPVFHTDETVIVTSFLANKDGDTPTDPDELLYENRKMNPIVAPDGHQLTFEEFSAVTGRMKLQCREEGTKVTLRVKNLVPFGLYTAWVATLDESGEVVGLGATGGNDGSQSVFSADSQGSATFSQIVPEEMLSVRGKTTDCLLDEYEVHIVGAYHIDGRSYGPELGPAGTVANQFAYFYQP
ncbi:MAG: hypothetical protein AAF223_07615 [Bacteroidota bacterium]